MINIILTAILATPFVVMFRKRQKNWKSVLLFILSMINAISQCCAPAYILTSDYPILALISCFLSYGFWMAINIMATFN